MEVAGEAMHMEVASEARHVEVAGEARHMEVAGEARHMEVAGEVRHMEVAGEGWGTGGCGEGGDGSAARQECWAAPAELHQRLGPQKSQHVCRYAPPNHVIVRPPPTPPTPMP